MKSPTEPAPVQGAEQVHQERAPHEGTPRKGGRPGRGSKAHAPPLSLDLSNAQDENERLRLLATAYGAPLYVYSEEIIRRQYASLAKAVEGLKATICYAVKACSNISILRLVTELGGGFDIVSQGELRRVLAAGGEPSKVVFAGVGKTTDEVDFALRNGIRLFNVESSSELALIEESARHLGIRAPVSLRVNPDIAAGGHPYIATGLATSKFGIPIREVLAVCECVMASADLELVGLDCHIGSQITELGPLREAYRSILELAATLRTRGVELKYIDFGGGLGAPYSGAYPTFDLEGFRAMILELCHGLPYEFIFEPGKFLVAEAGTLLTHVVHTKENLGREFAIIDAGMNDLLRPSLYDAFHQIDLVSVPGDERNRAERKVDVVGPVCESGCWLAKERMMPRLYPGDLLAIRDSGAYGMAMASSYNSRRLPAEVLVSADGEARLIRKRDEFEDLWRNELF